MALLVNGELVTDGEIAQQRALLFASEEQAEAFAGDPRILRAAEENAVFHAVLRQSAAASGMVLSAEDIAAEIDRQRGTEQSSIWGTAARAAIKQDLQVRHFIEKLTRNVPRPSRQDVEAAYRAHRARYAKPASVHVRHIVVNIDELTTEQAAKDRIQQAHATLSAGENFATVADRFSDCRGAGGELGWIVRGEMVEEFDDVVFAMHPRTVSPAFPTRFGLHIAELLQARPARVQTFDEVRPALTREMHEQARQRALRRALLARVANADVRIVRMQGQSQP